MNTQRLFVISLFCIISAMHIYISGSENKIVLLEEEWKKSCKECDMARKALSTNPECSAYMTADYNTSKKDLQKATNNFYVTQQGQYYRYWYVKRESLAKMKHHYAKKISTKPRDSLIKALSTALFTDNYVDNVIAQEINFKVDEELTAFINIIEPEGK